MGFHVAPDDFFVRNLRLWDTEHNNVVLIYLLLAARAIFRHDLLIEFAIASSLP